MSSPNLNLQLSVSGLVAAASPGPGESLSETVNIQQLLQLLAGTGGGEADTFYETTLNLGASATSTLALNGGGLLDPFGAAVNFAHVKAIVVINSAGSAGAVKIGATATNAALLGFGAATHSWAVGPGEAFFATNGEASAAGWGVTASTAMNVTFTNLSGSAGSTAKVIIIGTST